MSEYLLGIDGGNTSIKIVLFDRSGCKIGMETCPSVHLEPAGTGFEEYDAEDLWRRISQSIRRLLASSAIPAEQIRGIGISTYGNGIIFLGENGQLIAPGIYSNDYRANLLADELKNSDIGPMIQRMTGGDLWGGQPAILLRWYKTYRQEIYKNIRHILLFGGYIVYRLTGCCIGNKNSMGGSALLDMQTGDYSEKLMRMYGIEEMFGCLPGLKERGSDIVGGVSKAASVETGLCEGTPVTAGMMDNMACFVGSGADASGTINMIAGSWCVNQMTSENIVPGASANMFYIDPGKYLNCSWSGASANNLEWLYKTCGNSIMGCGTYEASDLYQKVNHIISKDVFSPELYYLPFVAQPSIHPNAKAGFVGIDLNTTIEDMIASVAEGIVFIHKYHMDYFKKAGFRIEKVRLTGGIGKSPAWVELFARILEVPVEIVACDETGAHGAAIAAGVGAGVYTSYSQAFDECIHIADIHQPGSGSYDIERRNKYEKWVELTDVLTTFWNR